MYVVVDWLVSHAVMHSLYLFKFEQFIIESYISLENEQTYMHIRTICKGTFSPEVFTQWLLFLGFYSDLCYQCLEVTG